MKVIIVGGVAGGASCAARLRRLDEKAEILMVERGPYVSYANCGLPYHVGDVIEKESSLLVATEQTFRAVFAIDCRTRCEVTNISPQAKTVEVKNHVTGEGDHRRIRQARALARGGPDPSAAARDRLPGDLFGADRAGRERDPGVARRGCQRLDRGEHLRGIQAGGQTKRAVVVGGGYIGLEMAENLFHRGLEVTVVEMLDQVMAPLDPECARLVERYLEQHGVGLALGDAVAGFEQAATGSLEVLTKSGKVYPADIVILAIGVRPETALARAAGLEIGERGGIRVDDQMHTSDPDIFAVGDAVEVTDYVAGEWSLIPLAGPANRQGRIVADVICGRASRFRGTQGTSVIGIFGATVAMTGANEKLLVRLGQTDFEKAYLFPNSHAGYYPGAKTIVLKVIFRKSDGRLLGAQALGLDGVEKRIDVLAMAIQMGATVYDLEESELCTRPHSAARRILSTSRVWSPPTSSGVTCRSLTGPR